MFNNKGFTTVESLVVVVISILLFIGILKGLFVDKSVALRALEIQGYTDVQVVGEHRFFVTFRGCGARDAAQFIARAKNSRGKEVEVFVCAGWPFKGQTVRTY